MMTVPNHLWTTPITGLIVALLAGGCAGKKEPPPFTAPAFEPSGIHFAGTALSGPTGVKPTASARAGNVPGVHVTFVALEQMPAATGKPLGAQVRLVVADRASGPILPSPLLTRDARLLDLAGIPDPIAAVNTSTKARNATIVAMDGMLAPGLTAAFSLAEPANPGAMSLDHQQRRIEISVRHIPGIAPRYEYALMVDDYPQDTLPSEIDRLSTPQNTSAAGMPPAPTPRPVIQRELAVLDRPATNQADCIALVLPWKSGMAEAIAAIVQVSPAADDDPHRQALASALRQAAEAADTASKRPRIAPLAIAETPGFAIMIASLGRPESRRAALAYLAARSQATLCEDLSLVGDDESLAGMADRVQKNMADFAAAKNPEELGWLLERTCLELLADLSDKGKLSPELTAILARNLGEAGRQTASIQEILRTSRNRAMLDARVLAENLIYIEDASPAARVRAYDWLVSRGRAPAGFDPLGTARQRRDALEKARSVPAGVNP